MPTKARNQKAFLNERQRAFAQEYLIDLNQTQAAIRAGYSAKTASQTASRLLSNVKIQEAIEEALKARSERTEITADRVLEEYAKIAFTNLPGITDVSGGIVSIEDFENLTPEQQAAISEVAQTKDGSLRIKLHSKTHALDSIGKHLGMFTQRIEHSGEIQVRTLADIAKEVAESG